MYVHHVPRVFQWSELVQQFGGWWRLQRPGARLRAAPTACKPTALTAAAVFCPGRLILPAGAARCTVHELWAWLQRRSELAAGAPWLGCGPARLWAGGPRRQQATQRKAFKLVSLRGATGPRAVLCCAVLHPGPCTSPLSRCPPPASRGARSQFRSGACVAGWVAPAQRLQQPTQATRSRVLKRQPPHRPASAFCLWGCGMQCPLPPPWLPACPACLPRLPVPARLGWNASEPSMSSLTRQPRPTNFQAPHVVSIQEGLPSRGAQGDSGGVMRGR